jgi:hypothetical protein
MTDYVLTRGTMSLPDKQRLNDKLEAFTAPLQQMAQKATSAGFPLAPSTVRK